MTNQPINPKTKKLTKSYSQANSNPIQDIKSAQRSQYVNNNYDGQTEFYAVVLREEKADRGGLLVRGLTFGFNSKSYVVRARIPRLHDGQLPPVPKVDKTLPNRNRDGIIDLHPAFEGTGTSVPKPGDILRVSFLDRFNSSIRNGNGRVLEIIASPEKGVPGDAEIPGVSCKAGFVGCPKPPEVNITKKLLQEIEKYERRDPLKNPSQRVLDLAAEMTDSQVPEEEEIIEEEAVTEEEERRQESSRPPLRGLTSSSTRRPKPRLTFPPMVIVARDPEANKTKSAPGDPEAGAPAESPSCQKVQTVADVANTTAVAEKPKKAEEASNEYIYPVDPMGPLGDYRDGSQQWRVTSKYGYRNHPVSGKKGIFHKGVDIGRGGRKWGKGEIDLKPCYSSLDGIAYVGFQERWKERTRNGKKQRYKSGAGWFVRVHHAQYGKLYTLHMHLKNPLVKSGDYVKAGDQLGIVDNSGGSSGPHNHFEVREGGTSGRYHKDPAAFLKKKFKKKTGFDWTKVKKSKNSKGYFQLGPLSPPNGSEP